MQATLTVPSRPAPVRLRDVRVLMVAVTGFCVFLNVYATQPLLPLFTRIFGATKFHASLTVSATTIGIALAAPFFGLLAERFGRKRVMAGSVTLLTIPILLAAGARSLDAIIAWRFVQGLIMPGIIAVTMAYISEEWAGSGSGKVMGAYVSGNVLGGVCGRVLSGLVASRFGWQASFVVLGALNAIGAAMVWRWLPHPGRVHHSMGLRVALRDMAGHLRRPVIVATCLIGFAMLFALVATFTFVAFLLAGPAFRLNTVQISLLFLVYLVGVVVTPLGGHQIDRIGHTRALHIAVALSVVGVLLTLIPSLVAVVAGLAISCTGIFICQSAATSFLGHAAGKARPAAAGLYTTFYYLGGTAGAAVPALTWAWGGWPACVGLTVGMLGVVVVLAGIYWRGAGKVERVVVGGMARAA